jgi:hypothetical protein
LVWLVLFLVAAAPAGAAPIRLAPASGEAGVRTTLAASELPPDSTVELRVGRGRVKLLRTNSGGHLTTRQRIPRRERGRVRVAIQDARGSRVVLHYRVRSRWSAVASAASGDWQGRVLDVTGDLRLGKLAVVAQVRGLAPGAVVAAKYAGRRMGTDRAGEGGRATISALLPQTATGRALTVRGRGLRLATRLPTPPAVVALAGDIACEPPYETYEGHCEHAEVAALAASLEPDVIAIPGDVQYRSAQMSEFQQSFDLSWGQLEIPLRPTPGNHEYKSGNAADYFDYFELQSGWRPPPWYAYDVGGWRLLAINSNCEDNRVDCSAGSEQEQWLRANLAAEPHRCTLAYWHHPRYSSGFHGSDPRTASMWRALDNADAEIVVTGHDHHYERFAPQDENGQRDETGIREFVVGTGGSANSVVREPRAPHSVYAQNRQFGVLLLKLYSDAYSWRFVALNGKTLDHGVAGCY